MSKKDKAISLLEKIEKKHGKGAAMLMDPDSIPEVDVIPTGSLTLDGKLGVRGLPLGRIVEVYGENSTGKTTLLIQCMAEAQKMGLNVAYIDTEHAFDPKWAAKLGLDVGSLLFSQPNSAEQAMDICLEIAESGDYGMIVLDSTGALVCQAELDGDVGDAHIGLVPRLMAQSCRKLTAVLSKTNTLLACVSQMRANIQTFGRGPNKAPTGGNALKFYSSIRLQVIRTGGISGLGDESDIGNTIKIKVIKNKLAPPFKEANIELLFENGFCKVNEAISIAIKAKIIQQGGAWYTLSLIHI